MMNNKNLWLKALLLWLPFALAITIMSALVYVTVQQNFRMSANDPQIQLVQDAQKDLANGAPAEAFTSQQATDISKSLAPYILVFNEKGETVAGTAALDGQLPKFPSGVFDAAKSRGENRFTWQPKAGIRQAVILDKYESKNASSTTTGFVAVGRSIREIEVRENNLTRMALISWLAALLLTLLSVLLALKKLMPGVHEHAHPEHAHHTEHVEEVK